MEKLSAALVEAMGMKIRCFMRSGLVNVLLRETFPVVEG